MKQKTHVYLITFLFTLWIQKLLALEFRDLSSSSSSSSRRSFIHQGSQSIVTGICSNIVSYPIMANAASLPPPSSSSSSTMTEKPLIPGGKAIPNVQVIGTLDNWDTNDGLSLSSSSSSSPFVVQTQLGKNRIGTTDLSPLQPSFSLLSGTTETYYAPFLFGAWNTTATLKRKIYPFGYEYVPSNSLIDGSPRYREEVVGDSCTYQVHYFSTIANTVTNQVTVNLGLGIPETKMIQDRAYNAISLSNAYQQLSPVTDVIWDYRKDPTKVVLLLSSLTADMRPLGPRRTEIFIQAHQTELWNETIFASAEKSRSVMIAGRDVIVSETEIITEFHKKTNDHVVAISRIAVYLTPNPNSREGILWQQTGGKAIAFFDYELDMKRIKEDIPMTNGIIEQHACVKTPKDIIQCD